MYTLVVLCTVVQKLILWYLYSKLAFLAMKATLEVQKAVFLSLCVYVGTHFAQSWHSDCTKFACWLLKVCTNFAIQQQRVSIKIKFKLSSSQEPSQCLFLMYLISIKGENFCYAIHFDWKIARFIGKRNPTRLDDEMRYNNISWRENWSLVMKWHKINKCSEHSFVCVSHFIHTIHSW